MFGLEFPPSTVVLGITTGFGYGLLAVGLVIVYRSNRIINFAHGEVGAFGAAVLVVAVERGNVPYYVMFPIALVVGGLVAALAEVVVIRRLRKSPRLMSLVATLGIGFGVSGAAILVGSSAQSAGFFPAPPGLPSFRVGNLLVTPGQSGLLFFAPLIVVALAIFLRRSRFGLALRSSAANPEAARMAGVFASRMSTLAWAIGGSLSAFTAILVAPSVPGGLFTAAQFGPTLLIRGLAAAIVARMTNIPIALASGIVIGVTEGLLLQNFKAGGPMEVVLFGIILVALLVQMREGARDDEKGSVWATVQPWRPLPEELAKLWPIRNLGWILGSAGLAALVIGPLFWSNVTAIALVGLLSFAIVALSIAVITGLGGQLTLGQFALAAVGATVSGHIAIRTGGNPVSLIAGGLAAAAMTIVIGLPALRIRGLFLAVTTLSFAVATDKWVLIQPWALEDGLAVPSLVIAGRVIEPGRSYYFFALVVFVLVFVLARNVRVSGLGRMLRAVRDNEDAARAFGIRASKIKLQGFLISGFIAGIGGAVFGHLFSEISAGQFLPSDGVDVVMMSVAGGIAALAGPVVGILAFKGLPAFVPLQSLGLFATRLGPLFLIMYVPGGFVQLMGPLRERAAAWIGRQLGVEATEDKIDASPSDNFRRARAAVGTSGSDEVSHDPLDGAPGLKASGLTKTYGGLAAVSDVSLEVRPGETLGLIGPNGAGKTTLFEVLAGFVSPDQGKVTLGDADVTSWSPERRAKAGLIRSFQDVSLFPTLSVLDTVQLALERELPSGFIGSLVGPTARDRKREAAAREMVGAMGLWDFRDKPIQELSTGTRRIAELACLVALRPKLLLLDEPSSGIAQRETESLGELLEDLKATYDVTLFVIEHDIPLIMGLADRVIAMDAGSVLAEGSPEEVRNDPAVVEAYLGGRIEAIERSGHRVVRRCRSP